MSRVSFLNSRFQNHPDRVILKKYQSLSNQSFKHNLPHMPSLNLIPTLSFELRFRMFIINDYNRKKHSSHRRCSLKNVVLKNFVIFTGKNICQSLFFNKVSCAAGNFIKKRLWHRCFPVSFAKFLRTTFLQKTSGRLPLKANAYYP